MTPCQAHLVSLIETSRDDLIRESTDAASVANDAGLPREEVEQMIRACVAVLEEGLRGVSTDVRTVFLEALVDIAATTTWELTLKSGLPVWGILLGQLTSSASPAYRTEALGLLAQFVGNWWADVSKVMLPVFIAHGKA